MSKHPQQSTVVITFGTGNLFQGKRNPLALSRRLPIFIVYLVPGQNYCEKISQGTAQVSKGEVLPRMELHCLMYLHFQQCHLFNLPSETCVILLIIQCCIALNANFLSRA